MYNSDSKKRCVKHKQIILSRFDNPSYIIILKTIYSTCFKQAAATKDWECSKNTRLEHSTGEQLNELQVRGT